MNSEHWKEGAGGGREEREEQRERKGGRERKNSYKERSLKPGILCIP